MSMCSTKLYLRYSEAVGKMYLTEYEDEEKFKNKVEERRILDSRIYGTYNELMSHRGSDMPRTSRSFDIIDERLMSNEKWVRFQMDRIVGWKKGDRSITKELMELLGHDGKVNLDTLTNREKDKYHDAICHKIKKMICRDNCRFTLIRYTEDPRYMVCSVCGKLFLEKDLDDAMIKDNEEYEKSHPEWMHRE